MKKLLKIGIVAMCVASFLAGCGAQGGTANSEAMPGGGDGKWKGATIIELADDAITVNGATISDNADSAVYKANDIVFYLVGQGFTYGEGTAEDEHTQEEADAHTVVHITKPGTYAISGQLSAGQIAVDLGKDAKEDPEAVVNLILDGVDITCQVAPAVIFYNVYEPFDKDTENPVKDADTSAAGANVLIADDTVNNVAGSYVARIYKSVELNEAGTKVLDSKKLHKYDAAFYSKMTMNINGDEQGTGILNITAENEGLGSELHLTINGGNVNITSGNDGINTNEEGVSVTTVNGGTLTIHVSGATGEGDGIDSNGWLVINGGTVITEACGFSMDAGIDSDMGIHINGGTVIASGNMLDHISESKQNFAVFNFASKQKSGNTYMLKNSAGEAVAEVTLGNDFSCLVFSAKNLLAGTYTLWQGDTQLAASRGDMNNRFSGGERPQMPELPEGMEFPKDGEMPQMPEGARRPERVPHPEGGRGQGAMTNMRELSVEFEITDGGNYFNAVSTATEK